MRKAWPTKQRTSRSKFGSKKQKNSKKEDPKLMVFLSGLKGIPKEKSLLRFLRSKVKGVVEISFPKKINSGYAFVTLKDEAAKEEILRAKNLKYKKRELKAKEFLSGDKLSEFKSNLGNRRLFVCSLPLSTKDNELYEFFSKYGEVETAYLIRDRITNRPKSFGYVLFRDVETAREVAALDKIRFKHKKVKVQIHKGKNAQKPERREESWADDEDIKKSSHQDQSHSDGFADAKDMQPSRIGSETCRGLNRSSKNSGKGDRRPASQTQQFLSKDTPSFIQASRGADQNQNRVQDSDERSESSINNNPRSEKRLRVMSGNLLPNELENESDNNEPDYNSLQNYRQGSLDEHRVGYSARKDRRPRPSNRNDQEGLDEVPCYSEQNEVPSALRQERKARSRGLTHSLRPTNSAYFPERAEIFKEWFSKSNHWNNVERFPPWKRFRTIFPAPNHPPILQNKWQNSSSDWYQFANQTSLPSSTFNKLLLTDRNLAENDDKNQKFQKKINNLLTN